MEELRCEVCLTKYKVDNKLFGHEVGMFSAYIFSSLFVLLFTGIYLYLSSEFTPVIAIVGLCTIITFLSISIIWLSPLHEIKEKKP